MSKTALIVVIVIIVLIGGGLIYWYSSMQSPSYSPPAAYQAPATSTAPSPATTSSSPVLSATTSIGVSAGNGNPSPQSFAVHGNDSSADLTAITVPKGTPVTITFTADAKGTYHGGLDFRSSVVSTGAIAPGDSKTVSFTADNTFSFTPYWPSTNIKKPYVITVTVQ